ncbi:hypothetical protein CCACVL1_12081 [Corchorus capsularis]|uniref:Uncharacterized protein n=1 Tax=Corchorus capsularis TaxID=210143 RepID=A0A1R3IHN1_COCAP|nr:hypothetical protein CCACVL1_12081 [Corchorus capsularis]
MGVFADAWNSGYDPAFLTAYGLCAYA